MRTYSFANLAIVALTLSVLACGSSDTTGTGGSGGASSTSTTSAGGGGPPATSCIMPGDAGNDFGVGTYCTPGGGECAAFPKAGFCLADVGQDQWFCTRVGCTTDADCGMEAHCHQDAAGSACVPDKCEPPGSGGGGAGGGGAGGAGGGGGG